MKDGYTWSGGPWKIDHWTKGVELKLVPNVNYWGKKPDLNSVTITFFTGSGGRAAGVPERPGAGRLPRRPTLACCLPRPSEDHRRA